LENENNKSFLKAIADYKGNKSLGRKEQNWEIVDSIYNFKKKSI
jgi:hypothetical protein